ncbi:hypothetical protein [Treponema sp. R6D11]
MTVKEIITDYLKQNGYDGLHSHCRDNNLGGCGCPIKGNGLFLCGETFENCEPAYKHTKTECKKCPDFIKCEAFENGEKYMYCGKKTV